MLSTFNLYLVLIMDKTQDFYRDIWWLVVLRGVVLILLGLAFLISPGITLGILLIFLAIYVVLDGIFQIIEGIASISGGNHWVLALLLGIAEIVVGLYVIRNPGIAIITLVYLIGALFVIRGIIDIVRGVMGYETNSRLLAIIAGLFAIAVGALLLYEPISFAVLIWIYALFALVAGPLLIAAGLSLRSVSRKDVE